MPFLTDRLHEAERIERTKRALRDENEIPSFERSSAQKSGLANGRIKLDLAQIEAELRGSIVGQDHALDEITKHVRAVCADIGDARKPLSSILLAGPTGVGKTETVRLLARGIYGDADALCRIDMNTLAQEHYSAALTGAPPGYVGSKEGTTILDQAKIEGTRNLPGIILFDEIEKASNEVILALLNVLDNGIMTVASGARTISFRNAIIFMTTNLGIGELEKLRSRRGLLGQILQGKSRPDPKEVMTRCLLDRFPPEFVNRIDCIETFTWIGKQQILDIVPMELKKLNARLFKHGYRLEVSHKVVEHLAWLGYDERFGARELRRSIRKNLEFPLADYLLTIEDPAASGTRPAPLTADLINGRVVFERKKAQ